MLQQVSFVCAREHNQAAIALVDVFHCCPGAHDAICWSKVKVVEVYSGRREKRGKERGDNREKRGMDDLLHRCMSLLCSCQVELYLGGVGVWRTLTLGLVAC